MKLLNPFFSTRVCAFTSGIIFFKKPRVDYEINKRIIALILLNNLFPNCATRINLFLHHLKSRSKAKCFLYFPPQTVKHNAGVGQGTKNSLPQKMFQQSRNQRRGENARRESFDRKTSSVSLTGPINYFRKIG